jgi:hypothetical protein
LMVIDGYWVILGDIGVKPQCTSGEPSKEVSSSLKRCHNNRKQSLRSAATRSSTNIAYIDNIESVHTKNRVNNDVYTL